jgi:DNA-binding NtrC family response regulator
MIEAEGFRADLFCRLAVLTVEASPLRKRREDIPAMISKFLIEATDAVDSPHKQIESYRIDEDILDLLCGINYPGNIRSLRNLIYTLTSYLAADKTISIELVKSALSTLPWAEAELRSVEQGDRCPNSAQIIRIDTETELSAESLLHSIAKEGDILLPLELCVLRRGETFKQWTARAKRCSIEATRRETGGTMKTVAKRLGLTPSSLKSHLQRARAQSESLFDWQRESA